MYGSLYNRGKKLSLLDTDWVCLILTFSSLVYHRLDSSA